MFDLEWCGTRSKNSFSLCYEKFHSISNPSCLWALIRCSRRKRSKDSPVSIARRLKFVFPRSLSKGESFCSSEVLTLKTRKVLMQKPKIKSAWSHKLPSQRWREKERELGMFESYVKKVFWNEMLALECWKFFLKMISELSFLWTSKNCL